MKCPHCGTSIHLWTDRRELSTEQEKDGDPIVSVEVGFCPECNLPIITLEYGFIHGFYPNHAPKWTAIKKEQIYPSTTFVAQLSPDVPQKYANEYYEAAQVLFMSPKASATISRYLLQLVLHEELNIQKRNLEEEIKELEQKDIVSGNLAKMLQVFRKVANFGAHPKKSTNTGEIVAVEKGEAEIMLDILRELFDCLFVKPRQQQDFLNEIKEKYGIEV